MVLYSSLMRTCNCLSVRAASLYVRVCTLAKSCTRCTVIGRAKLKEEAVQGQVQRASCVHVCVWERMVNILNTHPARYLDSRETRSKIELCYLSSYFSAFCCEDTNGVEHPQAPFRIISCFFVLVVFPVEPKCFHLDPGVSMTTRGWFQYRLLFRKDAKNTLLYLMWCVWTCENDD